MTPFRQLLKLISGAGTVKSFTKPIWETRRTWPSNAATQDPTAITHSLHQPSRHYQPIAATGSLPH
jgi:hypothetical protein